MYLSRSGLFMLFGGGILVLLTLIIFVLGGIEALGQVWGAVFGVFAAIIVCVGLIIAFRRIDRTKFFQSYWALRLCSLMIKLYAGVMSLLFCVQLFIFIRLRLSTVSTEGALASGPEIANALLPSSFLIDFVVRSVALIVGAYAGAQLIDLFMSMELSLKTLAGRRRQSSEATRAE